MLVTGWSSPTDAATPVARGTDCPAAYRPYTADSALLDLLLNPATRGIIERQFPGALAKLPAELTRDSPPTFAAILSLPMLMDFIGAPIPAATLATLNAQLGAVTVNRNAAIARCARYDETAPPLPRTIARPAVLLFSKFNGFRDGPSVDAADAALQGIAVRHGLTLVRSENGASFNDRDLKRFDAVIWNNVSGDVLTNTQRRALIRYIESGGGFAAMHGSAGDPLYDWDWYVDTLIGARFIGHPDSPQFQPATVVIENPQHEIVRGLPSRWTLNEEWYSFAASPRPKGATILATIDESSYQPVRGKQNLRMGDHPIAWTTCVGNGRSFYSGIGHRPENYSEPNALRLLEQGVVWAAGLGATRCQRGREVQRQFVRLR